MTEQSDWIEHLEGCNATLEKINDNLERIATLLEKFQPAETPVEDVEVESEWTITLWSRDRGVKLNTFRADEAPVLGFIFKVDGVYMMVDEVQLDPGRKAARCKVRPLSDDESCEIGV